MKNSVCKEPDCESPEHSSGWCSKHYQREWRRKRGANPGLVNRDAAQFHRLTDLDPEKKLATCSVCGPESEVRINNKGYGACMTPRRRWQSTIGTVRHRQTKMGMSDEAYNEMLEAQDHRCALCREELGGRPHIDHDHSCCGAGRACSKCWRGILCNNCNTGLGKFKDDPQLLLRAAAYLNA